jgi:hypothetical protein
VIQDEDELISRELRWQTEFFKKSHGRFGPGIVAHGTVHISYNNFSGRNLLTGMTTEYLL